MIVRVNPMFVQHCHGHDCWHKKVDLVRHIIVQQLEYTGALYQRRQRKETFAFPLAYKLLHTIGLPNVCLEMATYKGPCEDSNRESLNNLQFEGMQKFSIFSVIGRERGRTTRQ